MIQKDRGTVSARRALTINGPRAAGLFSITVEQGITIPIEEDWTHEQALRTVAELVETSTINELRRITANIEAGLTGKQVLQGTTAKAAQSSGPDDQAPPKVEAPAQGPAQAARKTPTRRAAPVEDDLSY